MVSTYILVCSWKIAALHFMYIKAYMHLLDATSGLIPLQRIICYAECFHWIQFRNTYEKKLPLPSWNHHVAGDACPYLYTKSSSSSSSLTQASWQMIHGPWPPERSCWLVVGLLWPREAVMRCWHTHSAPGKDYRVMQYIHASDCSLA